MGARAESTAATRRSIADAFLALFAEQHYGDITLDAVAARAGVSVQTVIRHFGSKDELFAAVARNFDGGRGAAARSASPGRRRRRGRCGSSSGATSATATPCWRCSPRRRASRRCSPPPRAAGGCITTGWRGCSRRTWRGWRGSRRRVRHGQLVALTDVYVVEAAAARPGVRQAPDRGGDDRDDRRPAARRGLMARFLAYTSPARGHLFPIVGTLLELRDRGHSVAVRTLASEVPRIEDLGFDAAPIAPAARGDRERRLEGPHADGSQQALHAARGRARPSTSRPTSTRRSPETSPDVVLVDINAQGAAAHAEASGAPGRTGRRTCRRCPPPTPRPSASACTRGEDRVGRIRDALAPRYLSLGRPSARRRATATGSVRASGCTTVRRGTDLWRAAPLTLYFTAEPFEYPRGDWPALVPVVGPGTWDPPGRRVPPSRRGSTDIRPPARPRDPCRRSSRTTGKTRRGRARGAGRRGPRRRRHPPRRSTPPHSRHHRTPASCASSPTPPLLPRAVCVVCHGGMGITQRALAAGVPVCVVPFGRDQLEVAGHVTWCDAGTRVLPHPTLRATRLRDRGARGDRQARRRAARRRGLRGGGRGDRRPPTRSRSSSPPPAPPRTRSSLRRRVRRPSGRGRAGCGRRERCHRCTRRNFRRTVRSSTAPRPDAARCGPSRVPHQQPREHHADARARQHPDDEPDPVREEAHDNPVTDALPDRVRPLCVAARGRLRLRTIHRPEQSDTEAGDHKKSKDEVADGTTDHPAYGASSLASRLRSAVSSKNLSAETQRWPHVSESRKRRESASRQPPDTALDPLDVAVVVGVGDRPRQSVVQLRRIGAPLADGVGGFGELRGREAADLERFGSDVAPMGLATEFANRADHELRQVSGLRKIDAHRRSMTPTAGRRTAPWGRAPRDSRSSDGIREADAPCNAPSRPIATSFRSPPRPVGRGPAQPEARPTLGAQRRADGAAGGHRDMACPGPSIA